MQGPGTRTGAGSAPLMNFVGNSCSAAMTRLSNHRQHHALSRRDLVGRLNRRKATGRPEPHPHADCLLPQCHWRQAPACDRLRRDHPELSPLLRLQRQYGNEGACAVTVLDHFSTSFNWAQLNSPRSCCAAGGTCSPIAPSPTSRMADSRWSPAAATAAPTSPRASGTSPATTSSSAIRSRSFPAPTMEEFPRTPTPPMPAHSIPMA